ncbi:MAG TPA: hypothetical protein VM369_03020 [Candidatus Binatia bacterium]|nr:hypothetical protein [Candidatus Binatia bacterium]
MKRDLALALSIGIAVSLALFGLGFVAAGRGAMETSYALYWPAWALQQALPCSALFSMEPPCESRTAVMAAFWMGLPVGALVYAAMALAVLRIARRRNAA